LPFCFSRCFRFQRRQKLFDISGTDFFTKSESIFVGRLVDQSSYRSNDRRFIFTRYVFKVQELIIG